MIIYKNANDTMRVGAVERDGKFVIIVQKERKFLAASRKGTVVESTYSKYEKAFDTKEQANRYFLGI